MKDVYISDQISLAEGKFANDKDIDKIVFSPNVSYIPENCFNGCDNLKEIVFEGNIDNIEPAAFMNCENLNTIKANNINIIKDFAFHGCDNIVDFNIKENMANNIIYGTNNDSLSTYFLLPEIETPLNDIPWYKIDLISRKGKARDYFKVGDEKELIIGEYSYYDLENKKRYKILHPKTKYHIQILGFDHDDLANGTGKAGITVGLKEIMHGIYCINSTNSNKGGWEISNMRTYLQNNVLTSLPSDLQSVIKTVNKVSDVGNKDTATLNTTQDKLFLFSAAEVGLNPYYTVYGQGTQYDYFTNNISRIKKDLKINFYKWWLRSASTIDNTNFYHIHDDGNSYRRIAYSPTGIIFGFCI